MTKKSKIDVNAANAEVVAANEKLLERFQNQDSLNRDERRQLGRDLLAHRPAFLEKFTPWWWWWKCKVNVLVVTDGGLDFSTNGFGLSEFLTAFPQLEAESNIYITYNLTLAHRSSNLGLPLNDNTNPRTIERRINFKFTDVNLNSYDQIWLFGIDPGAQISPTEQTALENYMNGGGGLFATGDHGSLGSAMGSAIARVKDMRHWADFPTTGNIDPLNEVSMNGERRNDTNRPAPGDPFATIFERQSDDIPQVIMPRTFAGGLPHPLLSIPATKRSSKVIDIMPDHPHEGQCKPETTFTTPNGTVIGTQIIATSTVIGGSIAAAKVACIPHCFPSIAVFDGHMGSVGRVVVDSTWHHFVNINLNGAGSPFAGLTNADFAVVQHYYMNIARWMTRKKNMFCLRKLLVIHQLFASQIVEATLSNASTKRKDIALADLASIGALSRELLAGSFSPAFAYDLHLDIINEVMPELVAHLNIWAPSNLKRKLDGDDYHQPWINHDLIINTGIGSGFIALRDDQKLVTGSLKASESDRVLEVFSKGVKTGLEDALKSLSRNAPALTKSFK